MSDMEKCDSKHAWHDGSCCCNCKFRLELTKHPMNKDNKGPATESSGMYACTVFHAMGDKPKAEIMEWEHWTCELHVHKDAELKFDEHGKVQQ